MASNVVFLFRPGLHWQFWCPSCTYRLLCVEYVQERIIYQVSRGCRCLCAGSCSYARGRRCGSSMKALCCAQVFEWLTTDLKKFMDSTGRGPESAPMPTMQIKASTQTCSMSTPLPEHNSLVPDKAQVPIR